MEAPKFTSSLISLLSSAENADATFYSELLEHKNDSLGNIVEAAASSLTFEVHRSYLKIKFHLN